MSDNGADNNKGSKRSYLLNFTAEEMSSIPDFHRAIPILLGLVRRCYAIWDEEADADEKERLRFIGYIVGCQGMATTFYKLQQEEGGYDASVMERSHLYQIKALMPDLLPAIAQCRQIWTPEAYTYSAFENWVLQSFVLLAEKYYASQTDGDSTAS